MGALRDHFLNLYPYTNFHELNADWMIKMLMKMVDEVENFVAQNAIKYADPIQWNITRQYEKNTIVVDPITGTAYLSNHPVPMGIALSNTHYWSVVFDLGRFITLASQNFANTYEAVTTTTATQPTDEGNWVVWDSVLYQAKNDIHVGDAYIVDGNIEKRTVEDFFNDLKTSLASEAQTRADEDARIELSLTDLITSKVDAEAQARADEDARIELSLTDLITSKVNVEAQTRADEDARIELSLTDLVNSQISVVESKMISIYDISKHGAVNDGVTDNTTIIQAGIDSGMAVYIPKGVWATEQLELKYGTKIFGRSDGYGTSNGSVLKALNNTGSVIHANTGVNKFIIKDIAIDGGGNNLTCPDGISVDHGASAYLIENVYIKRAKIGLYLGSTGWATVRDVFVEHNYSDGFKIENNIDYRPLQINFINCLAELNNGNGFRFINNQDSVAPAGTMVNCATFANNGRGVIYFGGFSAIRMTNCFYGSDGNTELEINGNNGGFAATIDNCQFELAGRESTGVDKATAASNTGAGLKVIEHANVHVSNSLITSNSQAGVVISNGKLSMTNMLIRHNCQSSGGADIAIDQPSNVIATNNIIDSNKNYGLYSPNASDLLSLIGNQYANYTNDANYINSSNTTAHLLNNIDKNGQLIV